MKSLRSSCSELCESSEPKDAPVVKIPLRDHSEYPIYQDDIDRWQEFYKRIDVKLELLRMIEWFDANPSRKKTDRGIRLAANNWLIRANDREAPAANTEPCYKSNAEKMTAENPSWREEWLKDTARAC